jgi:hypothetical protein
VRRWMRRSGTSSSRRVEIGLLPDHDERPKPQHLAAVYAEAAELAWSVKALRYEAAAMRVGVLQDPGPRKTSDHRPSGTR